MASQPSPRRLRIGVDVGGTNTDGVILDPSLASFSPSRGILAHIKTATTPNPSDGIMTAITSMFTQLEATNADIHPEDTIASVTIGTTHFVNAVIERDPSRLSRVAVLRLSGPFSKHVPPCVDWPEDMRSLILGYHARVKGGLEVDGSLISDIDESEIVEQCKEIRKRGGIKAVVINSVFSPIDTVYRQEERAAEIVRRELGGQGEVDVVCSKEVANLGFLERENAAVLNASILRFARRTIREFRQAVGRLGLKGVPVFITQNDGTILEGEKAAELPIKTFSSGPTNSMRGAAFLVQGQKDGKKEGQVHGEAMMVVDIGGTTTDVGLLLPNGFPRQQAAYSELAGVRMNFSCPDIKSIGLGGGSIVRKSKNGITIGPDSVGYKINKEALLFGGSTLTTTDCTVLANPDITSIGDASLVKDALTEEETQQFKTIVRSKIEKIIDNMKTSPEDLPAILVGGGAVIAPDELQGASKVLKPRWSEVANAIGAAIARVSSVVDTIKSTEAKTEKQFLEEIKKDAIERTIAAGASPESVEVVEVEMLPLQYVENKTRFVVRAAGDFDFTRSYMSSDDDENASSEEEAVGEDLSEPQTIIGTKPKAATPSEVNVLTYTPNVLNRIWHISETDLTFISTGCYILGTGGGGSPYASMILLRQLLRSGASVRVVSPADVPDSAAVGCGCGAGSPTVSIEKLQGDEMMQAQTELYKALSSSSSDQSQNNKATHMIALEIGGGNGLQGMTLGASSNMDIPCVDGDWMGRAYPTKWQTTPVVFNERSPIWSPIAVADGNGNVLVMPKAASDAAVEKIIRAALSQMGSQVGAADPPVTGAEMKRWVVENTVSQAWRLGRAVARARAMNRLDEVAETIVEECGGGQKGAAAKVLFKGKIVGVRRTLRMGHVYGECIIEGMDVTDDTTSTTNDGEGTGGQRGSQGVDGEEKVGFTGKRIKIPFKNENIAAIRIPAEDGSKDDENQELEKQEDVLAIVPDLISVIDAQSGEAVGTPEYRYGLLVIVIGIAASDKWTGSQRGIDLGGPKAFGFDHLKYDPLGRFVKPVSVIDEFDRSI
ncbi:hypothetical protein QR685DRAFT_549745 [Neurospora intermedia]|uniref:Hydantoinase n=1 Tax=Neurospora intermedia TaxID=5142 RepID=A0ABR3DR03_NEUIN